MQGEFNGKMPRGCGNHRYEIEHCSPFHFHQGAEQPLVNLTTWFDLVSVARPR